MSEEHQEQEVTEEQVRDQIITLIQAADLQQTKGYIQSDGSAVPAHVQVESRREDQPGDCVKTDGEVPAQVHIQIENSSANKPEHQACVVAASDSSVPAQAHVQIENSREVQPSDYVESDREVPAQVHVQIENSSANVPEHQASVDVASDSSVPAQAHVLIGSSREDQPSDYVESVVSVPVQAHIQIEHSPGEHQGDHVESNNSVPAQARVQIESRTEVLTEHQPGVYVVIDDSLPVQEHVHIENRHEGLPEHQRVGSDGCARAQARVHIENRRENLPQHQPKDFEDSVPAQSHSQVENSREEVYEIHEIHEHQLGSSEGAVAASQIENDGEDIPEVFDESDVSEVSMEVHVRIEQNSAEYLEDLDENLKKAVELIRNGTHLHKAAKMAEVPFKDLEVVVKELKSRGDLKIDSCRKGRASVKPEIVSGGKKQRQFIDWNYTAEDVQAAANAVKDGEYTVKSAHRAFKVPERAINRALKGEHVEGRICTPGRIRLRKRGKLTEEEEKIIVEYSFALHRLRHPVTLKAVIPLARQLLQLRDETLKDEHGWWEAFVKRHQELASFWSTPREFISNPSNKIHWTKQYFERIVSVFEAHNFFAKPSRIYACEVFQFEIEQWEQKVAKLVQVEILVAANAVGYHVLPPCVVYASEGEEIPDFMGLPEAGFVASDDKTVSAAILVEWFRSVFLHYLPARTQEDPLVLILRGKNEWLTPELITMADQQHVHLIPIPVLCLDYLSPLLPVMFNLKDAYKQKLHEYKQTNLLSQVRQPKEETFYPVTLRKLFSSSFSMYEIQESFKATGVFPLKPDEVDLSNPSAIETKWETKSDEKKKRGETKREKKLPPFRKYSDMVFTDLDKPKPPPPVVQTRTLTVQNHLQVPLPGGGVMLYPQQPSFQSGASFVNLATPTTLAGGLGQRPALINMSNLLQPLAKSVPSIVSRVNTPAVATVSAASAATPASTARTSTNEKSSSSTDSVKRTGLTPAESKKVFKLTRAFGEETANTLLNVQKKKDETKHKSSDGETTTTSSASVDSAGDGSGDTSSVPDMDTQSTDGSEIMDVDEGSNGSDDDTTNESAKTSKEPTEDQQENQTEDNDVRPIPIKICKVSPEDAPEEPVEAPGASHSRSQEKPTGAAKRKSPRKAQLGAPDANVDAPGADTNDVGATESTVRKSTRRSARTSESSATVDDESGTLVEASAGSLKTALSANKSTIESSKKKSTRSATKNTTSKKSKSGAKTPAEKKTSRKSAKSLLSSTQAPGDEEDDEEFDDLASFDSEIDDDDTAPKSRTTKEKSPSPQIPKMTLKPNVTVPSSVLDRIQAMISGNDALLTSLEEKEAAAKVKPPPEPTPPKRLGMQMNESVESRLSKAFNADVFSSVMAVKQDLAKRPPLLYQDSPVPTINPAVQVLPVSGNSPFMYTLPRTTTGGPIVIPGGTLYPVQQGPMIIQPVAPTPAPSVPAQPVAPTPAPSVPAPSATAKGDEKDKQKSNSAATKKTTTKTKSKKDQGLKTEKRSSRTNINQDSSEEESENHAEQTSKRRQTDQQSDEGVGGNGMDSDPDFVVNISDISDSKAALTATPVRKSSRTPKPKSRRDAEDNGAAMESPSPPVGVKIEGSRKRKASFIKRQTESTALESPKKSKVDVETTLSGRTTRASSKEVPRSKRTKSLKK